MQKVGCKDRKSILQKSKRCFNCLRIGHNANTCRNEERCRHWEGGRHKSICPKEKPDTKNEKDESEMQPESEEKNEFVEPRDLLKLGMVAYCYNLRERKQLTGLR